MKLLSAVLSRYENSAVQLWQTTRQARAKAKAERKTGNDVCLYGDSTFAFWADAEIDLAPFKLFNSAFGVSKTNDHLLYMEKLVVRFAPKVIVYYGGSIDILFGGSPMSTVTGFVKFVKKAKEKIPGVVIVFVCPIKSPIQTFRNVGFAVDEVCRLAFLYEENQKNVLVCDPNEEEWILHPRYYLNDGLHLTKEGHQKLAVKILPTIKKAWQHSIVPS
jgi:hypothetical protein